jgi:hypothetical protein
MIIRTAIAAALLSTSLLASPASAQSRPVQVPAATESAHDQLFQLFKQSDEDSLRRNPITGLFRGDLRYADQFGDYISDEYYAKEKSANEAELAALHGSIAASSMRPTRSPTMFLNIRRSTVSKAMIRAISTSTSSARSTTSRVSTLFIRPSPAARRGPVQDGRGL